MKNFSEFPGDIKIPTMFAQTWLDKTQFLTSLLNPKKCFTIKSFTVSPDELDNSLGKNTIILRNFVLENTPLGTVEEKHDDRDFFSTGESKVIECFKEAYNKRAEPLFSIVNKIGYDKFLRRVQKPSTYNVEHKYHVMFKSPYFNC